MSFRRAVLLIVALLPILVAASAQVESFDSPRIDALAKEPKRGNSDALAAFWEEVKGKAPLVEI